MTFRTIFFLLAVGLAAGLLTPAAAQVLTIRDAENGEPLEAVTVTSQSARASAMSDARGRVDLGGFRDAADIWLHRIGYKDQVVTYDQLAAIDYTLLMHPRPFATDAVVVSATRWEQDARDVASKTVVIPRSDLALRNPQTAADLLATSGQVYVQKSQLGGGSPMIRGFSTNRVLIAVDGVRMNTAIFRSGNVQNVISLDPFATQRTEVVFGPGAVMYGSDAIGAVMGFYTLEAPVGVGDSPLVSGNATLRTSSANLEKTAHADLSLGLEKWGFVTSVTASDYDNLSMGSEGPDDYLRPWYVERIGGRDTTLANGDPTEQVPTGYRQLNLMQKVRFRPGDDWEFDLGLHYSTTGDYARYDRLVRTRNGQPRSAEWYYGPQIWSMNALKIAHTGGGRWYDHMRATFAYHYFEESRNDRDFRDPVLRNRTETVDVYSANLDFERLRGSHLLLYGAEAVVNSVGSSGEDRDIVTGATRPGPTRYPDGSSWNSYATYLNYRYKAGPTVTWQGGLRYSQVTLEADFDTTFYPFPFREASIANGAINGSLGMAWHPTDEWQINLLGSTGFRAPNIDDVGKVFDSEPGAVVVPNPDLRPEYAYSAELAVSRVLGERVKLDMAGYYSLLDDALVRRDFTLAGRDSIVYDGELSRVQAIQNAASATVYGVEAALEVKFPSGWGFYSRLNFQDGEEELDDGRSAPLRHAAPWFGDTHLTWTGSRLKADFHAEYNGELAHGDMAPSERDKDYIYALDEAGRPYSPGWMTLNLKTTIRVTERAGLSLGVENILDRRYRPYSSGISAAGRNFIAGLNLGF